MLKKTAVIFLVVATAAFCYSSKGFSQEVIPADKKALLKEMFEVSGVKEQMENNLNVMLSQWFPQYMMGLKKLILVASQANTKVPLDKKEIEKTNEDIDKINQRFKEEFPKQFNSEKIFEEEYLPAYDRYFSKEEISELINFYKSPIGIKVVKVIPQLRQELMLKLSNKGSQLGEEICNEILGSRPKEKQQLP